MPLLYIAIFIHFLNAVNADNMDRGFTNFHSRTGDFTGFWTESSDDCRNFTKRSIKEGLKMAQGHFTRRGKYGGFYCFPLSRMLSRIGPFETEIIDDKNNYRWVFSIKNAFGKHESWVKFLTPFFSNYLQPIVLSKNSPSGKNSLLIRFGNRAASRIYCKRLQEASNSQHYEYNSQSRICTIFNY